MIAVWCEHPLTVARRAAAGEKPPLALLMGVVAIGSAPTGASASR